MCTLLSAGAEFVLFSLQYFKRHIGLSFHELFWKTFNPEIHDWMKKENNATSGKDFTTLCKCANLK